MEPIPDRRIGGGVMAENIRGLNKLRRKLERISKKGSRPVARAAANGMALPLRKAIRRGVTLTSPKVDKTSRKGSSEERGKARAENKRKKKSFQELKSIARGTIGSEVKLSKKTNEYGLKVGFGAGRQSKKRNAGHERSVYGQGGAKLAGGVGIGPQNVHWLVLGTGEFSKKTRKARKHKSGKKTGGTKDHFRGVVPRAVKGAIRPALRAGAKQAKIALRKVAKKRR